MHGRSLTLLNSVLDQKFGKLTVTAHVGFTPRRDLLVQATCDCGNVAIKPASALKHGGVRQSCGCFDGRQKPRGPQTQIRTQRERGRFCEKFQIDEKTFCWNWTGYVDSQTGYGRFLRYSANTMNGAHRAAYELFVGPIPEGLEIDHLCRNRRCVNPKHLEAVTHRENILRGAVCNKSLRTESKDDFWLDNYTAEEERVAQEWVDQDMRNRELTFGFVENADEEVL